MTLPLPQDAAVERWSRLFENGELDGPPHTQWEWTCIAAAVRKADTVALFADGTDNPIRRGDARWCRAAVSVYEQLRTVHPRTDPEPRSECVVHEDTVRAWLSTPWTPPGSDEPTTYLEASNLDTFLTSTAFHAGFWSGIVVELAQDLGVFGVPGYQMSLDTVDRPRQPGTEDVEVTVTRSGAATLTSPPVRVDDLIPAGRAPIDAIVAMLQTVADVTNHLVDLDQLDPRYRRPTTDRDNDSDEFLDRTSPWDWLPPLGLWPRNDDPDRVYRIGPSGRAFPALDRIDPTTTDSPALPTPAAAPVTDYQPRWR